jgi:hypothetical protein
MDTIWDKIKKNLVQGYETISDKTGEMTQIGRLKLEILAVKRDIEKAFIELGGRIYHSFDKKTKDKILTDKDVLNLVEYIRQKESSLNKLKSKVDQIRQQRVLQKEEK